MTDLGTKKRVREVARPIKTEPIKIPERVETPEKETVKV